MTIKKLCERLNENDIKYDIIADKVIRAYTGNGNNYDTLRINEDDNGVVINGKLVDNEYFERWLYV